MDTEAIAAKMRDKVATSGFDRSVKFDMGDEVIVIDGQNVSTTDAPADCTIRISKENFEELIAGELNPTAAFMTGKIKVEGDMSVAMQLSQLI
ncbi:SCP2 sterol-binding domain-containing protein [Mesorhizobium sp. YIM 152430]|jgi:putative sterol carrier protein|uniref:SCP2 sterol-binding domain-containing protein n=1 Tax=Mesorhizobium sp. YIM 152430 TaxID=3031761 RepID=UPI0023DB2E26|nr:SCP2 sterol-binding domain-containing protein [Mesorhizobium sp. YIM 152430]MDF1601689.1 SCP2 sterol-binding domain-containing protein [Mesorhizobium sp. YIM 152430]